ncbi:MAG: (d)CMP kinase [Chlamydiota bacterium]
MIITIDGPAGTGKSTVAKLLAKRLRFIFFDTGAMYRAATLFVLRHHIPLHDERKIEKLFETFSFTIGMNEMGEKTYFLQEEDVTLAIRSFEVTSAVSEISAYACVRKLLVKEQREYARKNHAVFEGRDMGSVVFPKAELKIFLTASPSIRAERRYKELAEKFPNMALSLDPKTIEEDISRRDTLDSIRKISPLICPKKAFVIDTTLMTPDEVVKKILSFGKERIQRSLSQIRAPKRKMNFPYRLVIFIVQNYFRLFYRLDVYGLEHFCENAAILASNHVSYLDPPVVAVSAPEEIHFLARESLFQLPFFGRFIRWMNSHPITGGTAVVKIFRQIGNILAEGKKIIIFPEGTRSESGKMGPMRPGIAFLSYLNQVPIIPVYVQGTKDIWSRNRKWPKLFGKMICVFGSLIDPKDFSSLSKKEAIDAISQRLEKSLVDLEKYCDEGALGLPP